MKRTIVFGDIHGCVREWEKLLGKLKVTTKDRLISVGDLICKGPEIAATLDLAMALPNLECVIGNHELRFLHYFRTKKKPTIKPYDPAAYKSMRKNYRAYMKWISKWPFYIDSTEWLVIHAGLRPHISLCRHDPQDLVHLRTIGEKNIPWYELYKGKKTAVFGHWVKPKPVVRKNAIGLDTGCVYGGKLSALVLPERKIVSVQASRNYYKDLYRTFQD